MAPQQSDCASEHAVSCMEWALRSLSSQLLSHHAAKTVNSNTLAISTCCHHETMPCKKSSLTAHRFMLQLLPKMRGKGSKCGITFCCNILCEITGGLQSRLCLLWIQSCIYKEGKVKNAKIINSSVTHFINKICEAAVFNCTSEQTMLSSTNI